MNWVLLPSLMAIIIKLWLLLISRRPESIHLSRPMLGLLFAMLTVNVAELALLSIAATAPDVFRGMALPTLKCYYIAIVISVAFFVLVVLDLTRQAYKWLNRSTLLAAGVITLVIAFSPAIVAGVTPLSYTMTRVAGDHYWVFPLYCGLLMMASYGWLLLASISGQLAHISVAERKRCLVLAIAFVPTLLSGLAALLFIQMGFETDVTLWLSSATSLFLIALIWSGTAEGMFALLQHIPGTREWKTARLLRRQARRISAELMDEHPVSFKASIQVIEHALILQAYLICGKNIEATAEQLGVSVSTVRRKIKPPPQHHDSA